MAEIDIQELVWDERNEAHLWERHHRTRAEVEEVCFSDPATLYSEETYNSRLRIIWPRQDGRLLVIILSPLDAGRFYVVTAKPLKRQETRRYNAWKDGKQI